MHKGLLAHLWGAESLGQDFLCWDAVIFSQDPLSPGLWLLTEGEVLPGSSRFAADAIVCLSVFTPLSLR